MVFIIPVVFNVVIFCFPVVYLFSHFASRLCGLFFHIIVDVCLLLCIRCNYAFRLYMLLCRWKEAVRTATKTHARMANWTTLDAHLQAIRRDTELAAMVDMVKHCFLRRCEVLVVDCSSIPTRRNLTKTRNNPHTRSLTKNPHNRRRAAPRVADLAAPHLSRQEEARRVQIEAIDVA